MTTMTRYRRKIDADSPVPVTDDTGNPIPGRYRPVHEVIIATVKSGATHEDAALFAGISPATLSVWITRGLDELARLETEDLDEPPEHEALYVNLALEVARADAVARVGIIADWRRNMRRDWRAAERFMAKRYAGIWADRSHVGVELSGPGGGAIPLGATPMSHTQAKQMKAELEARHREIEALEAGEAIDVESTPIERERVE